MIEKFIVEGKIVPSEVTLGLLKAAMERLGWEGGKYLIDGFPRNAQNLDSWTALLADKVQLKFCLFLECSEACMEARLLDRGKSSGRSDDNVESIRKRFHTFAGESIPIVELLEKQGLVRRISAERSVAEVWQSVRALFAPKTAEPTMVEPKPVASCAGPDVVFVLGGPGSGKGTQCARITEAFGFHHLSAGDLLREERARPGSETGKMIEQFIVEGKIVPSEVTMGLIQAAMERAGWSGGKYLIDGFPRNAGNLDSWNRCLADKVHLKFCLFLECSEACMEARLIERGKSSGRSDDNVESIRKRFRTFVEESVPIVEQLEVLGLVRKVSAERSVPEVWDSVRALFVPLVAPS
eukprot:NODE_11278_length_1297_cov_3.741880.p1 GENE.NODE_11278_length_1297_cov_3.741880~~NODE_11278_length_1297_cov_3.741880.p1  ORF type:complete len:353 (+),score=89.74 NODE_11278_length_1297_cov_3.741880:126-1184(+)